jgi:hypothetical protein
LCHFLSSYGLFFSLIKLINRPFFLYTKHSPLIDVFHEVLILLHLTDFSLIFGLIVLYSTIFIILQHFEFLNFVPVLQHILIMVHNFVSFPFINYPLILFSRNFKKVKIFVLYRCLQSS